MELKQIRCTTCGYSLKVDLNDKIAKCDSCGNSFLIKQGIDLAKKEEDKILEIKKLRINLNRAIEADDINTIAHFSKEILSIIPDDYRAIYFNAYATSKTSNPSSLKSFYKDRLISATNQELNFVIDHMINNFDLTEYKIIKSYIDDVLPEKNVQFNREYAYRIRLEDNYSNVPRDIFVCYRSTDDVIAKEIVMQLEKDGNSCWINSRNLRPNDNENYWDNISEAIENCEIFLVISSQESMLSKDVQKEMSIANKLKKERIEFKVDDSVHTTLFKHFFDGLKWINAIESKSKGIEELKNRIVEIQLDYYKEITETTTKIELEENIETEKNINIKTIKERFPNIDINNVSKGFLDALKEIIRKEEAYSIDEERYKKEIAPIIMSIENQISSLEALTQVQKDYYKLSVFLDNEYEQKRKERLNQEIELENRRIVEQNNKIYNQIDSLNGKIYDLENGEPEPFIPSLDFLEKFDISDNEKEEIRIMKEAEEKIEKVSHIIQEEIDNIKKYRNRERNSYILKTYEENYGEPTLKWLINKEILKNLNNPSVEKQIKDNGYLMMLLTPLFILLTMLIVLFTGALGVGGILYFFFLIVTYILLYYYLVSKPYQYLQETFKLIIRNRYDNETNKIIAEKSSFLRLKFKETLNPEIDELKLKYMDFDYEKTDELFKDVATYVVEEGKCSLNKITQEFGIGFNRATQIVNTLEKFGIVSENVGTNPRTVLVEYSELSQIFEDSDDSSSMTDYFDEDISFKINTISSEHENNNLEKWTCECGFINGARNKSCGNCYKKRPFRDDS